MIFSNLCDNDLKDVEGNLLDKVLCESLQDGIMRQGLYTAGIKYWDQMRILHQEFFNSDRSRLMQKEFFNKDIYSDTRDHELTLFRASGDILVKELLLVIEDL